MIDEFEVVLFPEQTLGHHYKLSNSVSHFSYFLYSLKYIVVWADFYWCVRWRIGLSDKGTSELSSFFFLETGWLKFKDTWSISWHFLKRRLQSDKIKLHREKSRTNATFAKQWCRTTCPLSDTNVLDINFPEYFHSYGWRIYITHDKFPWHML